MKKVLDDARGYRERAEEIRTKGRRSSDTDGKAMLAIADYYERMAQAMERVALTLRAVESRNISH